MKTLFDYREVIDLLLSDESLYCAKTQSIYWRYNEDASTIVGFRATISDINECKAEAKRRDDGSEWYDVMSESTGYLHDDEDMLYVVNELVENGYEVIE